MKEIIEFPVLQVDAKSLKEVNRFHQYVRPTERPFLTSFCTNLTGIVQVSFDNYLTIINRNNILTFL